jgi:hypothetical protein
MAPKRKPERTAEGPSAKKAAGGGLVNPKRVNVLKEGSVGKGPVIYWWGLRRRPPRCAAPAPLPARLVRLP